jgi:tetratricopeptide (TPR) repeat protein
MRSTRKPLLFLLLVGMVAAGPALAQSPSSYPAACEASKVSKTDVERAHTVFLSGKSFLDEANYDKAISYFKDAYSIDCSVHGILPIIATAYERKGDKGEAIHALEEYLQRVPNASDHDVVEHRIRNLKDQLAQEKPSATPVPVLPSTATVAPSTATAPATTLTVEPTAAPTGPSVASGPPSEGRHSVAPWVMVGAGGALLVAGAVVLAVGSGDVSSADRACPGRINCADGVAAEGNRGRGLDAAGVVVGIAGIAGVAGGLVWHFVDAKAPSGASASRASHLVPVVAPGFAGAVLGGSF